VTGEYASLVERLESIAADIDEMSFDRLREAVADGEVMRPADDKKLMQARRAIEKAAGVLRKLDETETFSSRQSDW
jgi:hypothetical protein